MSPEELLLEYADGLVSQHAGPPPVLGLCGAQGSGKSTLAAAIARQIHGSVVVSLDDLYLTRAERNRLASQVHPLLQTRGVPGTHDVGLGITILDDLASGRTVRLPVFSKARDDRAPATAWPEVRGARLVVFEGWCVGATAIPEPELTHPVNALEQTEDADQRWRRGWNARLAGDYQQLFSRITHLALLAAPGWDAVLHWRLEQEHGLRRSGSHGAGIMTDDAVARFIRHYERLTRHILAEMPGRADLVLYLDRNRRLLTHRRSRP